MADPVTTMRPRGTTGTVVRALDPADAEEVRRVTTRLLRAYPDLERRRVITTDEATVLAADAGAMAERAGQLAKVQRVSSAQADKLRAEARAIRAATGRSRGIVAALEKRAARGRSTAGLQILSDFAVSPPVIRVHEGEATRISFVLRKPVRDLFVEIWQYLDSREGHAGGWHFPTWKNPQPGYQDTFWDGMRSRPPETGTYRVCITVHGGDGHTERVFDQIRVENPNKRTVRPRNDAKRYLASLRLDGKTAVLSDTDGYAITMRAVSQDPPDDHQRDRTNYHTAEPARLHLPRPEPSPRCGTPQVRHDLATKRLQRADVDL